MVYPGLFHPSYELERTISPSNQTIYKHSNEKLETLQMNISNSIAKNVSRFASSSSTIYLKQPYLLVSFGIL